MVGVEKIAAQTVAVRVAVDDLRAALDDCGPALRAVLVAGIDLAERRTLVNVTAERRVLASRGLSPIPPSASQMTANVALNGKYDGANDAVLASLKLRPMTFKELWAAVGRRFHTQSKNPKNVLYQAVFALKRKGRIKKVAGKYTLA